MASSATVTASCVLLMGIGSLKVTVRVCGFFVPSGMVTMTCFPSSPRTGTFFLLMFSAKGLPALSCMMMCCMVEGATFGAHCWIISRAIIKPPL